jgi:hypothetical protein
MSTSFSVIGKSGCFRNIIELLAENEILRRTLKSFGALELESADIHNATAVLESTKRLLARAEQREERLGMLYDNLLIKISTHMQRKHLNKWLQKWALISSAGGTVLTWRSVRSRASNLFRSFALTQWRKQCEKNIQRGRRAIRIAWKLDTKLAKGCFNFGDRRFANRRSFSVSDDSWPVSFSTPGDATPRTKGSTAESPAYSPVAPPVRSSAPPFSIGADCTGEARSRPYRSAISLPAPL